MTRLLMRGGLLLGAALRALLLAIELRWDRTFDVPQPTLRASADSTAIVRGRYLAYGPAHCASCHVSPADRPAPLARGEPPRAGGMPFALPVGTWYVPDLTPDSATGIGRLTDGQFARVLRHNVRADGRSLLPAMEFQNLADEDVVALLSFLRA